jgi:hygromycin-B 4-O-kinase
MSTVKTKIDIKVVQDYLVENFDSGCSGFQILKGGEVSQAFSFFSNGKRLVIRVTIREDNGFLKDMYAYDNFSVYGVPIPKIIKVDKFDKYYFAISEQAFGKVLDEFNGKEIVNLMQKIANVLDSIHSVDISDKKGFGDWNIEGVGKDESWKESLIGYLNRENESWEKRYGDTFFEKELFDKIHARLQETTDTLLNYHYLVHADYGFDNTISDGKNITGVIDWEHSKYGDFLYDVAWLEFWAPGVGYSNFLKNHYKKSDREIDNWNNRMLSCIFYFGVGSLGFFASSLQKKKYDWTKERLLYFLNTTIV